MSVQMPEWAPKDGPWCLKRCCPFNKPSPKYDTCLKELNHEGDFRGITGSELTDKNYLFLGQGKNK